MHIVIIGNGVSGITTARHIRKLSEHTITVISSETDHFFSRTALMYIYMGHMKYEHTKPYEDWFWMKNRINLIKDHVTSIQTNTKTISLKNRKDIAYDKLVLATGSVSNKFGWPGQDLGGVQGLYSYQDLELLEKNTKQINRAVIVGGGLIGIELAEMLHSRHIPVTFLIRESKYWNNILPNEEAELVGKHILKNGIDLKVETELKEILADENGRAKAVITSTGETIDCQLVGLTAGVSPNIQLVKNTEVETDRGILVNEYLETNQADIYALGDCAQFRNPKPGHPPVEQLWYTGKMQAEALAKTICGKRTKYERGIWFNSAKFFDVEYQTYGMVFNKPREAEQTFYWQHPEKEICFRMVFKDDFTIIGFNFFGIRFRQVTADKFIRENYSVEKVLENLSEGFFDPEFYTNYQNEIIKAWNIAFPNKNIRLNRKKSLFALFSQS